MTKYLEKPYINLLPPLAKIEFEALKASIELDGVRDPVVLDEDGNILDGHHRHQINPDAPTRVIEGLTEGQKRAFVLSSNLQRRNLSLDQKSALREKQIETARALKGEGETQESIAARLGVTQQAVSQWLDMRNTTPCKAHKPDNRVRVPKEKHEEIFERVEAGEPQKQIAADFGVDQSRVSRIAKGEKQKRDNAALKTKPPPPVTDSLT